MRLSRSITAFALAACMLSASVSAAVMGTAVTTDSTKGDFTNLSVKTVANKVTVTGSVATAKATSVSFYVTDGSSSIAAKQVLSDTAGTFEMVLVLNPERYNAENTASIIVGAMEYNSRKIIGIPLYSQSELDSCVSAFTSITSETALGEFLNSYSAMLGISEIYNQDELKLMYTSYSQNPPVSVSDCDAVITAINSLLTYIADYREFFTKINEAGTDGDGSEMKRLLTVTYKHIIPFSTSVPLIQNEAAMYQRLADGYSSSYTSFADVEAAFTAARDAQAAAEAVNGAVTQDRSFNFANEWKLAVNGNRITISGRVDAEGVRNIAFHATDSNAESPTLLSAYQVRTDDEGAFSATFAVDPALYGTQTAGRVRVSGYDVNVYQFVIPLYSASVLNQMTTAFKAISDAEGARNFLDSYDDVLAIGAGYGETKIKILCELFAERDQSGIAVPEEVAAELVTLDDTVSTIKDFVDKMSDYSQKERWANMEKAVEKDFQELAEQSKAYARLKKLSEDNNSVSSKGVYLRMKRQSYSCIQDIIDAYNTAYDAQYAFENPSQGSLVVTPSNGTGTGGGGGGGGGTTSVEIGSAGNAENAADKPQKTPLEEGKKPVEAFKDLSGYEWAEEAINALRNIGVLRGDGDGNYRPEDSVKREELLSMLLKTFYIEAKGGGINIFSDVKSGEWYFDTVLTAYSFGVTNGMGDGSFGIGEAVTRADMVAMAARLIRSRGLFIEEKTAAKLFGDYTDIPEYAYNDVVTFQQAGIVQGDDMGNFNPNESVTRAEAAVFFHNIFKYIENQI